MMDDRPKRQPAAWLVCVALIATWIGMAAMLAVALRWGR